MPVITFLGSEKTLLLLTGRHPLGIGSAPSKRSRNKWPPREANYRKQMSKKWSLSLHAKTFLPLLPFSPLFFYFYFLLFPFQSSSSIYIPPLPTAGSLLPSTPTPPSNYPRGQSLKLQRRLGCVPYSHRICPERRRNEVERIQQLLNRSQNSIYNVLIMEYKSSSRLRPISYNLLTPFVRFMPFVSETPTAS